MPPIAHPWIATGSPGARSASCLGPLSVGVAGLSVALSQRPSLPVAARKIQTPIGTTTRIRTMISATSALMMIAICATQHLFLYGEN